MLKNEACIFHSPQVISEGEVLRNSQLCSDLASGRVVRAKPGDPRLKSHLGQNTLFLIFRSYVLLGPAWAKDLQYDCRKTFVNTKLRTKYKIY